MSTGMKHKPEGRDLGSVSKDGGPPLTRGEQTAFDCWERLQKRSAREHKMLGRLRFFYFAKLCIKYWYKDLYADGFKEEAHKAHIDGVYSLLLSCGVLDEIYFTLPVSDPQAFDDAHKRLAVARIRSALGEYADTWMRAGFCVPAIDAFRDQFGV